MSFFRRPITRSQLLRGCARASPAPGSSTGCMVIGAKTSGGRSDFRSGETRWNDPDNRERPPVEDDRLADRARPSAEPALPEAIAQDRDRSSRPARSGRHVVLMPDRRSDRGVDAEQTEVTAGDEDAGDALGGSSGRKAPGSGSERQHAVERGGVVLEVTEEGIRQAELIAAHHHQPVGLRDRQVPKNERVENAEDGRVRANPERECQDDGQRERGPGDQRAHANFRFWAITSIDFSTPRERQHPAGFGILWGEKGSGHSLLFFFVWMFDRLLAAMHAAGGGGAGAGWSGMENPTPSRPALVGMPALPLGSWTSSFGRKPPASRFPLPRPGWSVLSVIGLLLLLFHSLHFLHSLRPRLERQAADDLPHERLEPVARGGDLPGDAVHGRPVVALEAAAEAVDQQLLGQRLRDSGTRSLRIWRISAGFENFLPPGSTPLESTGKPPSMVRHLPIAS